MVIKFLINAIECRWKNYCSERLWLRAISFPYDPATRMGNYYFIGGPSMENLFQVKKRLNKYPVPVILSLVLHIARNPKIG